MLEFPGLENAFLPAGDTSSTQSLLLARRWLKDCITNHHTCPSLPVSPLPRRVLDLSSEDVFLYESRGESARYAALSYCWGSDTRNTKTTRSNISARKTGIHWEDLSQTFQDALQITRRLQIQYIWIDSLCILQDDHEDWKQESSKMVDIYGNAFVTICAADSSSTSDSCYKKGQSRYMSKEIEPYSIHVRQKLPHISHRFQIWTEHSYEHEQRSRWMTRAWTLQELMLSPRLLFFTANEIAWECASATACECASWHPISDLEDARKQRSWRQLVSEYTSRSLTLPSDKLVAISGLAMWLQRQSGDTYLAGLWRKTFWADLLWSASGTLLERPIKWRAPSWSWACVDSRIRYEDSISVSWLKHWEVECQPVGLDKIGELKSAKLTVSALIFSALLYYNYDKGEDSYQYEVVYFGTRIRQLRADYVLSSPGHHYVPSGTAVSVLILGEDNGQAGSRRFECLVLRKLQADSEKFERLGLVTLSVELDHVTQLFDNIRPSTVTIV